MSPIEDILAELTAGRMIVLMDDESRENEGDLLCAAEKITPEIVNFMATHARGLICVPITGARASRVFTCCSASTVSSNDSTSFD